MTGGCRSVPRGEGRWGVLVRHTGWIFLKVRGHGGPRLLGLGATLPQMGRK